VGGGGCRFGSEKEGEERGERSGRGSRHQNNKSHYTNSKKREASSQHKIERLLAAEVSVTLDGEGGGRGEEKKKSI